MSDEILKRLVLGDELAHEFGNFNFGNLGFSLADFDVEEQNAKVEKNLQKKAETGEEHIKYINKKARLGKKRKQGSQHGNSNELETNNISISENPQNVSLNADYSEKNKTLEKNNSTLSEKNFQNNSNFVNFPEPEWTIQRKVPQETDLDLKLICIHDGEKIYKLSELFIPKDEKIIRKIERYNNKIMSISEKEKYDKENDGQKKEVNETDEIKQIIKKAKRNQKYTKINMTYDEKFFDRTHFLENIHASTLAHQEIVFMENKEQLKKEILKEGLLKAYGVSNDKLIDDSLVQRNLLNSLFYIKVKLKENEINTLDTDNVGEYTITNNFKNFDKISTKLEFENNEKMKKIKAEESDFNKIFALENLKIYSSSKKPLSISNSNMQINKNGIINCDYNANKTFKEDKNEIFSLNNNTNYSEVSFSLDNNSNDHNITSQINKDEYDEIIFLDTQSKSLNNNKANFENKLELEQQAGEEAAAVACKTLEEVKNLTSQSFEEAEIFNLNKLILSNVEKNLNFHPDDIKNDKTLITDNNHNNKINDNLISASATSVFAPTLAAGKKDYFKASDKRNDLIHDDTKIETMKKNVFDDYEVIDNKKNNNSNKLMELDNQNANMNMNMDLDFDNYNNFSFQNKRLNFTNASFNNFDNSVESLKYGEDNKNKSKSRFLLESEKLKEGKKTITPNISSFEVNGNQVNNNYNDNNLQKPQNSTKINKQEIPNQLDEDYEDANSESQNNDKRNNNYNEADDDYTETSSENMKTPYPIEDIFETKEFKLFDLKQSSLLKAAAEGQEANDIEDDSPEVNNLQNDNFTSGINEFKFNKPFPNINKESEYLQQEKYSQKNLKDLNIDNVTQSKISNVLLDLKCDEPKNNLIRNIINPDSLFKSKENEFLGFKKERDLADKYDLYNKAKCEKHKKQAYYNDFLLTGDYLPAILLSEADLNSTKHKYFDLSKKIFDINDYNMSFELLKPENSSKLNKEKDPKEKENNKEGINSATSNAINIDLGTGVPQTKAELSLRESEIIVEPLPILPLNEEIPKSNLTLINKLNINNHINQVNAKKENENLKNISHLKEAANGVANPNANATAAPFATYQAEDFFNNLSTKLNLNNVNNQNQNFLKIGKAKGNLLTHAKCSYNLTYNKINLTYDDLRDFHRPNFCKYLLREKKKKNFSFSISEKYNLSRGDKIKRWDASVLTRNFLKKQEKKRISKNIQYMNAYEIFKDRYKLSLNDGKFALFEHLDEYPLFVSNFGMASKLKKFLYTPKLFNVNVANPNTKLSEVELKTYNITGPYGSQILLQPNQKLPLIGQIDQSELKGISVIDNKIYRCPVFYEKVKNPTIIEINNPAGQKDDNNKNKQIENEKTNNKLFANRETTLNTSSAMDISIQNTSHSHSTRRRNILSLNNNNLNKKEVTTISAANNNLVGNNHIENNINNIHNINNNNINLNKISFDPNYIQEVERNGKKYYNFLLVFRKSKEGKENFIIREIEHNYIVAQEEPKIEVYPPQSRQYNNFLKKKIQTYTYKLYDEIGYKRGINFKEFTNLFPNVTEQILKKNFREMNIDIDKNICFFSKIPSEDNHMLITPENICQFESCQFGIYKLREVGIKNLTNPDKISYATNKFINQTPDPKQQFLGRVVEEELLTTPWNITQNFLQSKQIKGMLAIKGIGDPSNGQGGYSFLKMPVKTYNDNKTLKEEIDILKNANKNIKTVTGTDADLRKLSKEDIKMKLIQLGQDEEIINKLSRWERVSLLRYRSSQAAQMVFY